MNGVLIDSTQDQVGGNKKDSEKREDENSNDPKKSRECEGLR